MLRIAVLGSGEGSNFQAIANAIAAGELCAEITAVISDRVNSGILQKARKAGVPHVLHLDHRDAEIQARLVGALTGRCDLICLAGYMRIVRPPLLTAFPRRIVNIHPSLLPAYPGKDAWKQAFAAGEKSTGCSIHYVDEGIDTGQVIAQAEVPILPDDTPKSLHARIQQQERFLYPRTLQRLIADGTFSPL